MKYWKNNRGYTLQHLVMGMAGLGALLMVFAYVFTPIIRSQLFDLRKQRQLRDVAMLAESILLHGRLAKDCFRRTNGSDGWDGLECNMDFENPPLGNLSEIRFEFDPAAQTVTYRREPPGGGALRTGGIYEKILGFNICTRTEMEADACTIAPVEMSEWVRDKALAYENKYIRFQLQGAIPAAPNDNNINTDVVVSYQGGFYMREDPAAGITYVWQPD